MRHLTIRNIPSEVAEALEKQKDQRRTSLSQTVIDLLGQALGTGKGAKSNGLAPPMIPGSQKTSFRVGWRHEDDARSAG